MIKRIVFAALACCMLSACYAGVGPRGAGIGVGEVGGGGHHHERGYR